LKVFNFQPAGILNQDNNADGMIKVKNGVKYGKERISHNWQILSQEGWARKS